MDREQLILDLAMHVAEGMDLEELIGFAVDTLRDRYDMLSEAELLQEVREYAPWMIDEDLEQPDT